MFNNFASFIPYLVLLSHILLLVLFFALLSRNSWGKSIAGFLGRQALWFGFLVAVVAVLGSLFYSEVIGFEPCVLCWWQRIFLYPMLIIFSMALWKKNDSAFLYVLPLAVLGGLIAAYQSYILLGGVSLLPCTALEGDCSKIYVMAFGYITIPMMSLTISLYTLLLAWADRIYRNENSNA
ncbi:MAG: disulfide bond formation protein B [Patescibacteria group bacterium]